MKKIQIKDKIYGTFTIEHPVIVELIQSASMQRLKGIAQHGIPDEFYHRKNYYRYEHSLGVFLLLNRLGASVEEQIAGLIHDVSHTAFSHVADYVFGDAKTQNFQDSNHLKYLQKSGIAEILATNGYDVSRIADLHNFSLLDRDIPFLCADRIDYAVRELDLSVAKRCYRALLNKDGTIIFDHIDNARLFGYAFLERQVNHWSSYEAKSRYNLLAKVLQRALHIGIIQTEDFWRNDTYITKKLIRSKDEFIQKVLSLLRKKSLTAFPKGKDVVYSKFRYVDPGFIQCNKIVYLSHVDKKFAKTIIDARKRSEAGIYAPEV